MAGSGGDSSQSQLRLRLPQLEDMVAWALCLMMEVASVQLTAIALRLKREEALQAATQAFKDKGVDESTHAGSHLTVVSSPPSHAFDRELSQRRLALFYYLVRSPIFDR